MEGLPPPANAASVRSAGLLTTALFLVAVLLGAGLLVVAAVVAVPLILIVMAALLVTRAFSGIGRSLRGPRDAEGRENVRVRSHDEA